MDNVHGYAEAETRALLAAATETISGPADLLGGVWRRQAARRQRRRVALAASSVGLAAAVAAGTLLATSVTAAPSAYAAVNEAATRTFSESYSVNAVTAAQGGSMRVIGQFDPSQHIGQATAGPSQIRWVGGHTYIYDNNGIHDLWDGITAPDVHYVYRCGPSGALCGDHWIDSVHDDGIHLVSPSGSRIIIPNPGDPQTQWLRLSGGLTGLVQESPADLLALLRTATTIRADGSASGPGWTGTRYSFSLVLPLGQISRFSGTVDVDQQGLVRHIEAANEVRDPGYRPIAYNLTFSNFGDPVSVAPPEGQVTKAPGVDFTYMYP